MQRSKHLTIVHKCNVLVKTMGLFRDTVREVAAGYPELRVDDFHVDAMAALLVRRMPEFDVLVTENMIGDILSDLTAELVGSLGLAPSINAGDGRAMAQAAHGSAPDIAGRGIANPMGLLLSSTMLLRWLSDQHHDPRLATMAASIDAAVEQAVADGVRTADLGGTAGTMAFANGVVERLGAGIVAAR
jgi:3-isopropylmalate dehydrogenase